MFAFITLIIEIMGSLIALIFSNHPFNHLYTPTYLAIVFIESFLLLNLV